MAKKKPISQAEFELKQDGLFQALLEKLQGEKSDAFIPEAPGETDVFDTPDVDSKTVIKLTPIVEDETGHKLKPEWVVKGGYSSVEEAALDVINKLRHHCYGAQPVTSGAFAALAVSP
ncbi:hypothetical protein [Ramlibacter sp.]|uniref:hypothetical protein n=1 Tax=Ramlibacter sp. TaxID=1917967 RepID=UPI002C7672D6|nr:hypothetical protein [Ramlibacter sp.]HWI81575.1 hypothetical protein [Ramlibacter sp.]